MRKMAVETLCFVFQDADGILSFSLNEYEGAPNNPRFVYDGDRRLLLLRQPGQLIALDSIAEEFLPLLQRSEKVRFVETPEDSSKIVRQYDISVTKIEDDTLPAVTEPESPALATAV